MVSCVSNRRQWNDEMSKSVEFDLSKPWLFNIRCYKCFEVRKY